MHKITSLELLRTPILCLVQISKLWECEATDAQKLSICGRASSLRPSGSWTQTQFHKLSIRLIIICKEITKTFIFSSSILPLYVHTRTNRCTSLSSLLFILIFIKSHIMFLHIQCFAHLTVLLFALFFIYCTFYFLFLFLPIIYIYTLVWCLLLYNLILIFIFILCTVHWADLIWPTFHFDYTLYSLSCDK